MRVRTEYEDQLEKTLYKIIENRSLLYLAQDFELLCVTSSRLTNDKLQLQFRMHQPSEKKALDRITYFNIVELLESFGLNLKYWGALAWAGDITDVIWNIKWIDDSKLNTMCRIYGIAI